MEPFDGASAGGGTFSLEGRGVPGQGVENEPGAEREGGVEGRGQNMLQAECLYFFFLRLAASMFFHTGCLETLHRQASCRLGSSVQLELHMPSACSVGLVRCLWWEV